jgi:hypothetical protein
VAGKYCGRTERRAASVRISAELSRYCADVLVRSEACVRVEPRSELPSRKLSKFGVS